VPGIVAMIGGVLLILPEAYRSWTTFLVGPTLLIGGAAGVILGLMLSRPRRTSG
jgi:hypothetical protein